MFSGQMRSNSEGSHGNDAFVEALGCGLWPFPSRAGITNSERCSSAAEARLILGRVSGRIYCPAGLVQFGGPLPIATVEPSGTTTPAIDAASDATRSTRAARSLAAVASSASARSGNCARSRVVMGQACRTRHAATGTPQQARPHMPQSGRADERYLQIAVLSTLGKV
jgi:hypothetical protein